MSDELVEVYTALNIQEAQFVKGLLEGAGIRAMVTNDNSLWAGETLPIGSLQPKVVVNSNDKDQALAIVADFDRHSFEEAQDVDEESENEGEETTPDLES